MTLRMLSCGTTSYEPGSNKARILSSACTCTASGAATGAMAAAGATSPLPDLAASTSRAMMRPCGPEPLMRARSMLASFARRRASGDEKIRAWPLLCAAESFAGAGAAAAGAFSAGAGAAFSFGASVLASGFASALASGFAVLAAGFAGVFQGAGGAVSGSW